MVVKRGRMRLWRIAVLICVGILVASLGLAQWIIWNPRIDRPGSADAILVLAYSDDRQQKGREVAAEGVSDNLVVSQSRLVRRMQDPNEPKKFPSGAWFEEWGKEYQEYTAHCIEPHPNTTASEVAAFVELAKKHDWDSVVVVTERSHLTRALLDMERCFPGTVYGVASEPHTSWQHTVYRSFYEMGAFLKDWIVSPTCEVY